MQIADALDAAHRRGILHRDLKPANVMVTSSGVAKLLDFGLAKLMGEGVDATMTMDGAVVGTAAYMSPEQAHGKPLDARSDVFSFGAVIYEMLAGERAFAGETAVAVIGAVIHGEPRPLSAPPGLERVVKRCLEKDSAQRFQTIADVRAALNDEGARLAGCEPLRRTSPSSSIAVLPFANPSADKENEYFGDGLAEEIINALSQVPGLKVIARTSAFAFKGKNEDVRRIAATLGVTHVLEGSVRRSGERIRVTVQLIVGEDGTQLWSERYDRAMADVFAIQDEIARSIASALQVTLAPPRGARRHTPSLPAYDAFLRGRHYLSRFTPESWMQAKTCLDEAIALDPDYAEPHAELGIAHFLASANGFRPVQETMPLVRAEAERALALNPSEQEPRYLLGAVAAAHDYNWAEAAEHFRASMSAAHVSANARWTYASYILQPAGRLEESAAQMQLAVDQDPLNQSWRAILASHLINGGLHERAVLEAQRARDLDDNHWLPHYILGEAYLAGGRIAEAIASATRAHTILPVQAMPAGLLAAALARTGDKAGAARLIAEMGDAPRPLWGRAMYHLICSEIDAAADWYTRMIEQREGFALVFAHSRYTNELRASHRWPALAAMMKLPG
jgi:eukaryotic-like serine/threonine-protein kinase